MSLPVDCLNADRLECWPPVPKSSWSTNWIYLATVLAISKSPMNSVSGYMAILPISLLFQVRWCQTQSRSSQPTAHIMTSYMATLSYLNENIDGVKNYAGLLSKFNIMCYLCNHQLKCVYKKKALLLNFSFAHISASKHWIFKILVPIPHN